MDGVDQLLDSFVGLFDRIYNQTPVPAHYLMQIWQPVIISVTVFQHVTFSRQCSNILSFGITRLTLPRERIGNRLYITYEANKY